MFGKWFEQTYTGSMYGAGVNVFAVWGYAVAHTKFGQVELNPRLIAAVLGADPDEIQKAIDYLCSPDLHSRSKIHDGRRLIKTSEFLYEVPNFNKYHAIRSEEDRRKYNRDKKRESRQRKSTRESNMSATVSHGQPNQKQITESSREGVIPNSSGPDQVKAPPSPKYTQTDYDERDLRKLSAAENDLSQRLQAAIGSESQITEQEFFTQACEIAGLTVQRGLKLKAMQRKWP